MASRKRQRGVRISTTRDGWTARVSRRPLKHVWGYCDYKNKEIVISKAAYDVGKAREIIIHEVLHKLFPCLSEESVRDAAIELDYALSLDLIENENKSRKKIEES